LLFFLKYGKLLEVGGILMKILLIIVSILLIAIVLLQSGKAVNPSSAIMGGNDELFANRKERGGELFITRLTAILGVLFFVICIAMQYIK
jgi:preprotein translocase subunit SecG